MITQMIHALLARAWIEIALTVAYAQPNPLRSSRGAWIEMSIFAICASASEIAPLCEGYGLKSVLISVYISV